MTGKSLARIMNYVGSMLPKSILVPTDLSDGAEQALDYACELAKTLGATIHLVNVIGIPALGVPELGLALTSTVIDQILLDNQNALDKLAEARRGAGVAIGQVLLKTGDAKDVINQTAIELGTDLIVMSTHGRSGISRALLGSVTETVVRSAPCPVLTVRIHDKERSDRDAA
jgi:nucleotide-binding universal stress UspA family protein